MSAAALHSMIPRRNSAEALGSFVMAIFMHALLVALLFFGIHWQSQPPAVIQAELWTAVPQIAAPAPIPEPAIEKPQPQPEVKVEPEPPPVKVDIAIKEDKPKKPEVKPAPKPEVKPEVKPPPKPAPKIEAKPAEPRAPSDLSNLLAQAGAPSTGSAAQTSGPRGDPNYAGLIQAKILSNLRFPLPTDLVGNPEARFMIEQLPSGEIVSIKKTKSSGLPAFDAAVERAIQASSPLPKGKDGRVEKQLDLGFHPLDKN
jgi:colicin import membrane protein